jgi:hypothetical protein
MYMLYCSAEQHVKFRILGNDMFHTLLQLVKLTLLSVTTSTPTVLPNGSTYLQHNSMELGTGRAVY